MVEHCTKNHLVLGSSSSDLCIGIMLGFLQMKKRKLENRLQGSVLELSTLVCLAETEVEGSKGNTVAPCYSWGLPRTNPQLYKVFSCSSIAIHILLQTLKHLHILYISCSSSTIY